MKFLSFPKSPFGKSFFLVYFLSFILFFVAMTPYGGQFIVNVLLPKQYDSGVMNMYFGAYFFLIPGLLLISLYSILLVSRIINPMFSTPKHICCASVALIYTWFTVGIFSIFVSLGVIVLCIPLVIYRSQIRLVLAGYVISFLEVPFVILPLFFYYPTLCFNLNVFLCAILTFAVLYLKTALDIGLAKIVLEYKNKEVIQK